MRMNIRYRSPAARTTILFALVAKAQGAIHPTRRNH
jgi:hypothetical protein